MEKWMVSASLVDKKQNRNTCSKEYIKALVDLGKKEKVSYVEYTATHLWRLCGLYEKEPS